MEGQTRMHQHANLHTQIEAFEKLLQHANSKFSRDRLCQMLKVVQGGLPYMKGTKIEKSPSGGTISSLKDLQERVNALSAHKRKGIQKEEESTVVQYFEGFFRDIQYLKNLKAYFDERIYSCLYAYYYDPLDVSLPEDFALSDDKHDDNDSGHSSQNGSDDETRLPKPTPRTKFNLFSKMESEPETVTAEPSPERERLMTSVQELYELNTKWNALFMEVVDVKNFDEESFHEVRLFKDTGSFEDVFRLVPDMFIKGFKSNRWAKVWWMQANKLYHIDSDRASAGPDTWDQKLNQLRNLITKFGEDIVRAEQQIIVFENDLGRVRRRESRVDSLTTESKKVERRKEDSRKRYNDIVKRRSELKHTLTNTVQGTVRYNLLAMELRDLEHDMVDQYEELKLLEYHRDLLQGDAKTEQDNLPQVKKFCESINAKIANLRKVIVEKRAEKRKCEKTLALLRTNCEKMNEIVSRGIRPATPIIEEDDVAVGPSFFITEAVEETATADTGDADAASHADQATADAVQERLKLLYKDFDFDDRYRPSSVATLSAPEDEQGRSSDNDETSQNPTPVGFRDDRKRNRKYVDHTLSLTQKEYSPQTDVIK